MTPDTASKTKGTISIKAASTLFVSALLISGIAAMTWAISRDKDDTATTAPANNAGAIQTPNGNLVQHLQYDPIANKHYFAGAGHNHWHDGPPPAAGAAGTTVLGSGINPLISQPLANQPNLGSRAAPNIPNPQPWQYDPITDQHFVPTVGHNHWHAGRPPNNPGQ